jgi:hypothetical protein
VPGHQRRDRGGPGPTLVGVVGQALRHQQRAEVGVADAELAELARVLADLLGRVVGVADDDLLGVKTTSTACLESVDVEAAVVARNFIRFRLARLHAELSMCMYSEHGFDR